MVNFHRRIEEQQVTSPYFRLDERAPGSYVLPRVLEASAFRWQGTPVNTTYTRLVAAGTPITERLADQVRREFKMPEKRVAYLRLIGLALSPNKAVAWAEIERMAFAKRPAVPLDVNILLPIVYKLTRYLQILSSRYLFVGDCKGLRGRRASATGCRHNCQTAARAKNTIAYLDRVGTHIMSITVP